MRSIHCSTQVCGSLASALHVQSPSTDSVKNTCQPTSRPNKLWPIKTTCMRGSILREASQSFWLTGERLEALRGTATSASEARSVGTLGYLACASRTGTCRKGTAVWNGYCKRGATQGRHPFPLSASIPSLCCAEALGPCFRPPDATAC